MIGKTISHYRIIEEIGSGGMGIIYKAEDFDLKRNVALKFLPPELTRDKAARDRFIQEARSASALDHLNICTIYEIGKTDEGQMFIAMGYYEGETLKDKLEKGPLSIDDIFSFATQIASGLEKAHKKGIVHRDIKPANIMITNDNVVKILDFGLAKLTGKSLLTKEGTNLGTISYMSPEQTQGNSSDHKVDQWSFGVILYEMLAGETPFRGDYEQAIIYSILNTEPEPIHSLREDVPQSLIDIVTRCLKKDNKERFASMIEIVNLLAEAGTQEYSRKHDYKTTTLSGKFSFIKQYKYLIAVLLVLSLFFGIWKIFLQFKSPQYLAVLPFRIIGEDTMENIYRDGLIEIINSKLTQLEQFQNRIWVISNNEIRNNDITSASRAHDLLGADLAITGSVAKRGGEFRFTLNLVNTKSLVQLKSKDLGVNRLETYLIEEKIIENIINMLNMQLQPEAQEVLFAGETRDSEANDYYIRGRGHLNRPDEIDMAISLFKLALETDSTFTLAYTGLGEAYQSKYRHTKNPRYIELAKSSCDKILKLINKIPEANITCGIIYEGIGEYEKAKETLEKALTLDPKNATTCLELGHTYFMLGKQDSAQQKFKDAIQCRPSWWKGYSYLGWFYYVTGEYEKAEKNYQKIVDLLPESDIGYKKLAAVYFQTERKDKAIKMSETALKLKPTYAVTNNLATIYYYDGQFEKAAEMYKRSLQFNKHDYIIYGNMGAAYSYFNQKDSSLNYYNKAIQLAEQAREINPRNEDLLASLAGYYQAVGNEVETRKLIKQVENMNPSSVVVFFKLGEVYEQLGMREQALRWMEKALKGGFQLTKFRNVRELKDLMADERFKKIVRDAGFEY